MTGEETLSESGMLTHVTVLKAGHHGSATSSGETFIEKLSPSVTVLSYGRKNRYGHPAEEVRRRLLEHGSKLYETGISGAVMVRTDGKRVKIKTMLPLDTDCQGFTSEEKVLNSAYMDFTENSFHILHYPSIILSVWRKETE